jgi:predicted secreted hydrolase
MMTRRLFLIGTAAMGRAWGGPVWTPAAAGHVWEFPRDHYSHDGYRTEWWYLTGVLEAEGGERYGFQFTIFRRGVRPVGAREAVRSRFVKDDFAMGHFTLSDVRERKFRYGQRLSRGAFGEAGFGKPGEERLAWIEGNELRLEKDGSMKLEARPDGESSLVLDLRPTGAAVVHGEGGLSRKSAGEGNASLYYSLTRMQASGTVRSDGRERRVTGRVWLDREWASNQLAAGQIGWDWFSLSLSDGSDLMLYRLRNASGTDPFSSGTLVRAGGGQRHLRSGDFTMTPGEKWRSAATGGEYPVEWVLEVPSERLKLTVRAEFPEQELALTPVAYWEGMIGARGEAAGREVTAEGYLEMTGYAAPLQALQR